LLKAILVAEAKSDSQVSGRELNPVVIGIRADREMIKTKITDRLRKRLDEGMISEVEELIKSGLSFEKLDSFGLEYRYVSLYIKGELNYEDMFRKLNTSIHNFAKRQMTWFRKMEREGVKINWIDVSDYSTASRIIRSHLNA
jgi:tRNA dimethylallyltransferase